MSQPNGPSRDCTDDAATCPTPSLHWSEKNGWTAETETLAVEAPLAIEITYPRNGQPVVKVLAVTMRTPGQDEELALGFLRAEGLIGTREDVVGGSAAEVTSRGERIATWRVQLTRAPQEDLQRVSRGLLTSSACGLCSRTTLEGLPITAVGTNRAIDTPTVLDARLIAGLPERLRQAQPTFFATGGTHGAALCDRAGHILLAREDVGRHNAVDKVFGAAWLHGIDCTGKILVLSGRASFELTQKAAAAGVAVIVAVGAPSSAAVNLAHDAGITLVGFTREGRFNVYAQASRLAFAAEPVAISR